MRIVGLVPIMDSIQSLSVALDRDVLLSLEVKSSVVIGRPAEAFT